MKYYTPLPIELCGHFSPRELYVLAGLYINAPYSVNDDFLITDTTYTQLSETTGVSEDYIKKSFIPKLKSKSNLGIKVISKQEGYMIRRNTYYLPNPRKNFRIIWRELFFDNSLSPEEKGVMIGLYFLCVNNEFRIDLPDNIIYERLGISINTYKKYMRILTENKIIWSSNNAPLALTSEDHDNAKIIMYPHLGYYTWIDKVEAYEYDEFDIFEKLESDLICFQ